jgi:hypothetical protein
MTLKRILLPEEESAELKEKAMKALMLSGFISPSYDPEYDPQLLLLLAASSIRPKANDKDKKIINS